MKPETYWPQDKLYFYATCALFRHKLVNDSLGSEQFKDYIPYYWSVDEQIKALEQLKQHGLLDFTLSRTDDKSARYSVTHIDSDRFMALLMEYLEKYRNDELIGDIGDPPGTFLANNDRLIKYLDFSTRDEPIVGPNNIWSNWTSSNSNSFPFWEVVLASQLIENVGQISDLGYSDKNLNSFNENACPFVCIKNVNKQLLHHGYKPQKSDVHKVSVSLTSARKLQLFFSNKQITIHTYKSEKNSTYRAAQALFDANGRLLTVGELNLKRGSNTRVKNLIRNMGFRGILVDLFIVYGDKGTVSLRRKISADEDQFKELLNHVKPFEQKNK